MRSEEQIHEEARAEVDAIAPGAAIDDTTAAPSTTSAPKTLGGVLLNKAAMFKGAARRRQPVRVELPWLDVPAEGVTGSHVYVRGLGATQKDKFDDAIYSVGKGGKMVVNTDGVRARLICLCTCTADGDRIFADDDIDACAELDARTADAIYVVASRESNLTQKDVEDMVKNSGVDPNAAP